jgi:hypothetical protein
LRKEGVGREMQTGLMWCYRESDGECYKGKLHRLTAPATQPPHNAYLKKIKQIASSTECKDVT